MPDAYATLLLCIGLLALVAGRKDALWVGCVVGVNFLACAALGQADGSGVNWIANAAIDFAAASLLLCVPVTELKLAVAAFYVPMLATHAWLAFQFPTEWTTYIYLSALSYLAWAQALVLAAWGGWDVVAWLRDPSGNAGAYSGADRRLVFTKDGEA